MTFSNSRATSTYFDSIRYTIKILATGPNKYSEESTDRYYVVMGTSDQLNGHLAIKTRPKWSSW